MRYVIAIGLIAVLGCKSPERSESARRVDAIVLSGNLSPDPEARWQRNESQVDALLMASISLTPGMALETVVGMLGAPDKANTSGRKTVDEPDTGFSLIYYGFKHAYGPNSNDRMLLIFFHPNGRLDSIDNSLKWSSGTAICSQLMSLRRIPAKMDSKVDDPVYHAFISAGDAAVPCLIDMLNDTRPMKDPRKTGPEIPESNVGFVAHLMLMRVALDPREDSLGPIMSTGLMVRWKEAGIWGHVDYMRAPENRKKYMENWKRWWSKKNAAKAKRSK